MIDYTTVASVDLLSSQVGDFKWGSRSRSEKLFIIFLASNDIETYSKVPRETPTVRPFIGEYEVIEACNYRAINISRNLDARLTADKVREFTSGNYSSSGLTLTQRRESQLDSMTKTLIDQFLMRQMRPTSQEFVRG